MKGYNKEIPKKGSCFQNPSSVVIKTYGLAIDREVSFIISPNSESAADSVLSSSGVKSTGLPFAC